MRNFAKILLAVIICLALIQPKAEAQGVKGVFNKTKEAINKATKKEVSKTTGTKGSGSESPSAGPAKPLAPEVKNSVSELRAYTGLTKEAFAAKLKSQGYVQAEDELGMGGACYKSKSTGYLLSVGYGTRGKSEYVHTISKGLMNKNPNLGSVKTTFLGLGKQCTDLKAISSGGWIKAIDRKGTNKSFRNAEDRSSKFLPAFDTMISTKEEGGAVDQYSEKDYDYSLTYRYVKVMGSAVIIQVTDLTIEGSEG